MGIWIGDLWVANSSIKIKPLPHLLITIVRNHFKDNEELRTKIYISLRTSLIFKGLQSVIRRTIVQPWPLHETLSLRNQNEKDAILRHMNPQKVSKIPEGQREDGSRTAARLDGYESKFFALIVRICDFKDLDEKTKERETYIDCRAFD